MTLLWPFTVHEESEPIPVEVAAEIDRAIETSSYPWDKLYPFLAHRGLDGIRVGIRTRQWFNDSGYGGAAGLAYRDIKTFIKEGQGAVPTAKIFLYEVAHLVDFLSFDAAIRADIIEAVHPEGPDDHDWLHTRTDYRYRVGEAWMYIFTDIFGDARYRPGKQGIHGTYDPDIIRNIALRTERKLFKDTDGHTHEANIERAVRLGLMTGYRDKTFKPNETVTRGQLATTLVNLHDELNPDAAPLDAHDHDHDHKE